MVTNAHLDAGALATRRGAVPLRLKRYAQDVGDSAQAGRADGHAGGEVGNPTAARRRSWSQRRRSGWDSGAALLAARMDPVDHDGTTPRLYAIRKRTDTAVGTAPLTTGAMPDTQQGTLPPWQGGNDLHP